MCLQREKNSSYTEREGDVTKVAQKMEEPKKKLKKKVQKNKGIFHSTVKEFLHQSSGG